MMSKALLREMSASDDPRLKQIAEEGNVSICACFPRLVKGSFHAAEADLPDEGGEVLNMRTEGADGIVGRLVGD